MPILETLGATAPYWGPALAGVIGSYALGNNSSVKNTIQQAPRFSPQEIQQRNDLISRLSQGSTSFEPIAERAQKNFQTRTLPSIAARFAGNNTRGNGAFAGALGSAASDLDTNLAALRSQYGLGQQNLLAKLLSQPQNENYSQFEQEAPGIGENFLKNVLPQIGQNASLDFLLRNLQQQTPSDNQENKLGGSSNSSQQSSPDLKRLFQLLPYLLGIGQAQQGLLPQTTAAQNSSNSASQYSTRDMLNMLAQSKLY